MLMAVGLTMALVSCGSIDSVTRSLESSTQNIKDGAQSLSKGMTGLDPLSLKQLVQTDDDLRKQLESLQTQLTAAFAPASIGIDSNTILDLEIKSSVGELSLNAWIDDPKHLFFQNQVIHDRQATLQFDNGIGVANVDGTRDACHSNPSCKMGDLFPGQGLSKGAQIDVDYKDSVNKAFQNFLLQPTFVPAPDIQVSAIQHWTMNTGEHRLHFQVTPRTLNNGVWSLSYDAFMTKAAGNKQVVFQGSLDGKDVKPVDTDITTFPIVVSPN